MYESDRRIKQLENTLMELGTEVYRNKHEIIHLRNYHENFVKIVDGLKKLMDEKGLITMEDFENAIALGDALSEDTGHSFDLGLEKELERLKKASH